MVENTVAMPRAYLGQEIAPNSTLVIMLSTPLEMTTAFANNATTEMTSLQKFSHSYSEIHGYISAIICIFGIFTNILNVIVLTRKNMISSTNYILTALAIADMLTMIAYLPFAIYFYVLKHKTEIGESKYSFTGITVQMFQYYGSITMHSIAMWLTVTLAFFRYIIVCHRNLSPRLCHLYRTKVTIGIISVATVILLIPDYLCSLVTERNDTIHVTYTLTERQFCKATLKTVNFYLYGVGIKITTCILLIFLSALLIQAMHKANQRRLRLLFQGRRTESEYTHEHNRTTAMLVAVVLLFVITELPQGLMLFLAGIDVKYYNVYESLGDVQDLLVLFNSTLNFILYCTMSQQFRNTFKSLFIQKLAQHIHNSSRSNGTTTYSTVPNHTTETVTTKV